jgi:hypothetical protein
MTKNCYDKIYRPCLHCKCLLRNKDDCEKYFGLVPTISFFTVIKAITWFCQQPNYTAGWNVWGKWFLAGNQGNHQNFNPSLIPKKIWPIFMGMKQKDWLMRRAYGWENVLRKLKNRQKMHFLCFLPVFSLRRTASRPYRLSHIIAFHINQSYWANFSKKKVWELAILKNSVFLSRPFFFFCFIPMKICQSFLGIKNGSKFW